MGPDLDFGKELFDLVCKTFFALLSLALCKEQDMNPQSQAYE
jgi:hypothetical protein